ncbi:MAG TPA: hypothetical protein VII13_09170 [Vicinamibacteria bacterium]|jgi:hypothetical protein
MVSLLSRVVAAVRVWIGLNDPSENRLHPSHGWLLPSPAYMRARALERALVVASAPSAPGRRR